jgi:hypothetical protein
VHPRRGQDARARLLSGMRLKEATRFKNGWIRAALRGVVWVNAFRCGTVGPDERAKRPVLEPSPDPTLAYGLVRDCAGPFQSA